MEDTWRIIGVALYLAVLLALGWVASRRMNNVADYFAGGKDLGFWSVAFSARATGESGWLLLGLTGMGATVGVHAFWVVVGETLGVALAWFWLARPFKRATDGTDALTIPDYLEGRFPDVGKALRIVAALAILIFVVVYVSAQIDATGKAFEDFLAWDYHLGAGVGFAVVMVYIFAGGFVAVVWSDVFQGVLMFLGLVVLPIVGLVAIGGFDALTAALEAQSPALTSLSGVADSAGAADWTGLAIASTLGFALIGLGFLGSPQIFVRFIALRNEGEVGRGAAVAITWTLLADSGAVLIGMLARAMFADTLGDGENALPMLVEHLMPAAIVGLYIAIVLSAIMSTVDSLLILGGSAIARDIYQKLVRPEASSKHIVAVSRWVTIALALVALAVAFVVSISVPDRKIFWFVLVGFYGLAATFCPVIILSLFWQRFNGAGALASMITGFVAMLFFEFIAPGFETVGPYVKAVTSLPLAFLAAFAVGIVATLLTSPRR